MADPQHPDIKPTVRLTAVDLSGGRSTISNDGLTTGDASLAKAIRGGISDGSGSQSSSTLVEAYTKWREREAAALQLKKAHESKLTPEDVEALAMKESATRLAEHLRDGVVAPAVGVVKAHQHYRSKGGRSSLPVWAKKIAQG